MRGIIAGGEELGELLTGDEDDRSFMENVKDPTYGFGRVVERAAPDLPDLLKIGLGFAGDVVFDPLTYASFGANKALALAGKAEGLTRMAGQGARTSRSPRCAVYTFRRSVPAEVLASSSDSASDAHIKLARLAIERSKALRKSARSLLSPARTGRSAAFWHEPTVNGEGGSSSPSSIEAEPSQISGSVRITTTDSTSLPTL